jgi:serine/threonine-protein kinase HipA
MAQGAVYYNGVLTGHLKKLAPDDYRFVYTGAYMDDPSLPSISLTLPKKQQEHQSPGLFSFFAGLLSEGINKDIQCRLLKIDEEDDFIRLLKTAGNDTIGAITVKETND